MTDTEREKLIDLYYQIGVHEIDLMRRRDAFDRMVELVKQRAPDQIPQLRAVPK